MRTLTPFPLRTLPEIIGSIGLLTDGDWVESKDQDPNGSVRLTQLADVGDGEFRDRSDRWMNDEQASRLNVTFLKPGDLLIARMPDPLGRACVCPPLPTRAVTVVDVCVVRAPDHNPKWLMHAINAPQTRGAIAVLQSGSTRKRISKGNLSTVSIPLPARHTQDALVAAIETHFSRLDAAVASLTRAKANVKRVRASVLKAAVAGRLVPTEAALARAEGRDYEPAAVLMERILAERRAAWAASGKKGRYKEPVAPETAALPELPEGWCWASADQLAWSSGYGTSVKCSADANGPAVLRIPNVQRGTINVEDLKFAGDSTSLKPDGAVAPGDFLFVRTNGSLSLIGLGAAVLRAMPSPAWFASYLIRLRLCGGPPQWRWVALVWNGPVVRQYVERDAASSAGQFNVSLKVAGQYSLPLPPLAEQHRIVTEVDRRLSVLDAIDRNIHTNLVRCARLRQSILKRAFEGRLVPAAAPGEDTVAVADAS